MAMADEWALNHSHYKNLYYLIDTAAGQSGAPIYYPGNNIAIGIHTTGGTLSNHGSRLTAAMVECMQTW